MTSPVLSSVSWAWGEPRAPAAPRRRWPVASILAQALILLSPALIHLSLNVPVYAFNEFQDQVFLQGILLDSSENLRRFGALYYNVRFGAILPEWPFWRALGPETGYLAFRWALIGGAGWLLYRLVARRAGPAGGVLAAGLFLLSPITARMATHTYVDLTAVTLSLLALAVTFFGPERRAAWGGLAAGLLFALAVNANFFAIVLLAAAGPAYLVAHGSRPRLAHLAFLGAGLAGFALACLAGFLFYRVVLGVPNLFWPTWETTLRLAGGGSAAWAEKNRRWLVEWPYIYAPVLLVAQALAIWSLTGSRLYKSLAVYALTCVAFFFVYDAFLQGYALRLYWYLSFLLPAMVLAALATTLAIAETAPANRRWAILLLPVLVLVGAAWQTARGWYPLAGWGVYGVWAAGLAAASALYAALRFGRSAAAAALVNAAVIGLAFLVLCLGGVWGPYSLYTRHREADDLALFRQINAFARAMPKERREPGAIRFLYPSDMPLRQRLIQSAYLGTYSSFLEADDTPVMLDRLGPRVIEQAREYRVRFVVLMSSDPGQIAGGAAWLCRNGLVVAPWRRLTLRLPEAEIGVAVLEVRTIEPASEGRVCGS